MVAADEDKDGREVTQMGGGDRQPLTTTVTNDVHGRHGAGGETKKADPAVVAVNLGWWHCDGGGCHGAVIAHPSEREVPTHVHSLW